MYPKNLCHRGQAVVLLCVVFLPSVARAQGEAYLRQFFLKKSVIAKIDLPATADGVDLFPGAVSDIDSRSYGSRLAKSGIAIRLGEAAVVSDIDVHKDEIEFHLGGGGAAREGALGSFLGEVFKQAASSDHFQLGDNKTKAEQALEALSRGSRFRLHYAHPVSNEDQTPKSIVQALSKYLEFPEEDFGPETAPWVVETRPARPMLAAGKGDEILRQFFEGRMVMVKIDMPGGSDGVLLYPERSPSIDSVRYVKKLREDGAGVGIGEAIMITKVKAKKDMIEFQLGGGGYGTFWQNARNADLPPTAAPSDKESELEKRIENTTDPHEKKRLQSQLDDVKKEREEKEKAAQEELEQRQARSQAAEKKLSLRAGSRFNIRYAKRVPDEALTPRGLMRILSEYVDFSDEVFGARE